MAKGMEVEQDLPGFRFHPTEEELLGFYLSRVVHGKKLQFDIIGTLNIYRHDPWELPGMAKIGEREWYFFVRRDRKGGSGGRPNRTTERGFWKATGSDRAIRSTFDPKRIIGLKKTLVFYRGRAPRGTKTDWVMNEYRLPDPCLAAAAAAAVTTLPKEDMVLCKIYRKATSLRELEQRAAMEEAQKASVEGDTRASPALCASLGEDYLSSDDQEHLPGSSSSIQPNMIRMAKSDGIKKETEVTTSNSSRQATALPELQVPNQSLEWMQDPFLTQLRSPWQDQHCWSPCTNLLYF